jgi:hypothetical protein
VQLGQLVLGQRLGREEVEGAGVGVLQDPVEDRQVVAEGLARGGRRDDHDVLPRLDPLVGLALVGVEPLVAPPGERLLQLRVQVRREVDDLGGLGREVAQRGQDGLGAERPLDLEALQDGEQRPLRVGRVKANAWVKSFLPPPNGWGLRRTRAHDAAGGGHRGSGFREGLGTSGPDQPVTRCRDGI